MPACARPRNAAPGLVGLFSAATDPPSAVRCYLDTHLSGPCPSSPQSKLFTLDFPALASVVLLSLILMRSTADSSLFNMLVTGLNVVLIIFVLCAGFPYTNTENYTPFMPFGTHGIFTGGWMPASLAQGPCRPGMEGRTGKGRPSIPTKADLRLSFLATGP